MRDLRKEQSQQLHTALAKQRDEGSSPHPFTMLHASAMHEAGHAVLAVAFKRRICSLTVIPDATGGGAVNREIKTETPKDVVEELFITFAGCEAADMYELFTDGSLDQKRAKKLNDLLGPLHCVNEETARQTVRTFFKRNRVVLEDLAAALFAEITVGGEAATALVSEGLSTTNGSIDALHRAVAMMLPCRSTV